MSICSANFVFFLAVVWSAYQFCPDQWRWLLLLLASLIYYALVGGPSLTIALLLVIAAAYVAGRQIAVQQQPSRQRHWLWIGIAANLVILLGTKYGPAAITRASLSGSESLILALGVSFYSLQAVGYLVDVFLREIPPEKHLGRLALYLSFFPKLLQGPIESGANLLPQLKAPYLCDRANMREGVLLFAWGVFKKAAVANRLAPYVTQVYSDVHSHSGLSLIAATYAYSIQIYADFSGYTDMALGAALLFNIKLTQNFRSPYSATSIADFWRRWHISFSTWILHYIFEPLHISWRRWGVYGTATALLITFLFSGLWHGVAWGFVVWGLLHGSYLAAYALWRNWRPAWAYAIGTTVPRRLQRLIYILLTFHLVTFAWIFFRARNLGDAWYIITHLFSGVPEYGRELLSYASQRVGATEILQPFLAGMSITQFALMVLSASVLLVPVICRRKITLSASPAWLRFSVYYLLACGIALLTVSGDQGFIYLQF